MKTHGFQSRAYWSVIIKRHRTLDVDAGDSFRPDGIVSSSKKIQALEVVHTELYAAHVYLQPITGEDTSTKKTLIRLGRPLSYSTLSADPRLLISAGPALPHQSLNPVIIHLHLSIVPAVCTVIDLKVRVLGCVWPVEWF